jgi:hypothetical protein
VELNDSNHLILKEDDIIGILETEDVKDMKPLSDRVLIKVDIFTYTFIVYIWLHQHICLGLCAGVSLVAVSVLGYYPRVLL